jgi:molybdenum cofactor cytidylyltransferase
MASPRKPGESCAAIVLAAGASTRLGRPKQLVSLDGETLLRRAARLAIEAGASPVVVVLGNQSAELTAQMQGLPASVAVNREWQTGMASSLKRGMQAALATNPDQANIMVLVCDQPRLDASILKNLLATHAARQPRITASRYNETLGVPAIFSRAIFPELMELVGDQGARRILQRHIEEVAQVDFAGGEIDLDTPEDLARLLP